MRRLLWCLAVLLVVGVVGRPAHAEKRVALVIGNSAYATISPLTNPKNDAALMTTSLREVGFEVVSATDADVRAMARAVRDFGKALRAAGKDAVGLFYYAGHGIQAGGTNYLVPVDAKLEDEADLRLDAISASDVLAQMESAGNALNLVILDACRNNPFAGKVRSGGRGLARIEAASGSMIAFAAGPGQVAADGNEANSPYTSALVAAMKEPGLTVEQVFKKVRVSVESRTGGSQTPWEESSLRGDFYFTPAAAVAPPATPLSAAPIQTAPTAPAVNMEAMFWDTVKDSGSPALLQNYVDQFPDGVFAGLAKTMIGQLETQARLAKEKAMAEAKRKDEEAAAAALLSKQASPAVDPAPVGKLASLPPTGEPFDGTWKVSRITPQCPAGNSVFIVSVRSGRAKWPVGSGTIGADGNLKMEGSKGGGTASFSGRLTGNGGSGQVRLTAPNGSGACLGRFTMTRIGQ